MTFVAEYVISGKGLVLSFELNSGDWPIHIGDTLYHKGYWYEVTGIEMSRGMLSDPIMKKEIGLVVKRSNKYG